MAVYYKIAVARINCETIKYTTNSLIGHYVFNLQRKCLTTNICKYSCSGSVVCRTLVSLNTARVVSHHYLHISGDSSAIVWHLYSPTTQNQSVWWADSAYRLTNIAIYDRCSTASTLCCWKESRQLGIRTSFRGLFGFRLKFSACLTVSVTVLVISAVRQNTEAQRCSFIQLAGSKSFWNRKRSVSLRRKLSLALSGHPSEDCVQQCMYLKHKFGSIRQMNMTFEGSKLIYSRQMIRSHASHPICKAGSIHILKQVL